MNSLGRRGETPLHAAATTGNADAARLLLARGADPLRKTASGETPLDVARWSGGQGQGDGRGVGGGGSWEELVRVLEGAVEEAEAAKAAAEADKDAKLGKEAYQGGRDGTGVM